MSEPTIAKHIKNTPCQRGHKDMRNFLLCMISLLLTGCDTLDSFARSSPQPSGPAGLAVKAVEAPARIANATDRLRAIDAYIKHADAAWAVQDFDALETIYRELDSYDPGNLRAKTGLQDVAMARRHQQLINEAKTLIANSDAKSGGKAENRSTADDELAMAKLHEVLLELPQHPQALPLFQQLQKQQELAMQERSRKKLSYKQAVSMEFRDVSLKMIFEILARTTAINFILDKEVPTEQKATIFVKNMAFGDALDLLLQTNQLEKKILSENSVIIYVNDPLHQREYKDLSVRSFTLEYADAKQLSGVLRSMLNIRQIETDPRLNTIILKDSPEILQLAEKIIYAQDLPDPEVMLEMEVLEVKRSRLQTLGVRFPTSLEVAPPGLLTLDTLRSLNSSDYLVGGNPGISFNANDADVNLLANPRIRVKNRDVAKIHIGEKVPVFTANVASTGVSSQTVQYIDAGLKLEVEPNISVSGDVTIKLSLNVGSIGDRVTASGGAGESVAFRVGTRMTTTQLRLHDGETQILAGLIDDQDRKNVSRLPGLSNIPLLGRLFSEKATDKTKTEIVLSITPHIIRERKAQAANQSEFWVGSEGKAGQRAISPAFLNGGTPFIVPKPPAAPSAATKEDKPQNLNIPLPPGFSLGDGLNPKPGE